MKGTAQNKNCPVCGLPLDINTYVPGEASTQPVEVNAGDVTFCFNCRTTLVFNQALNIVVPDEETLFEIEQHPGFHQMVNQIDDARRNKPNMN